jgi:hypothetical protein
MTPRKPFLLRLEPGLWKELEAWAQEELRSVNGQIEYLLRQAVLKRRSWAPEAQNKSSGGSKGPNRRSDD